MLKHYDHVPDGLLDLEANQLADALGGPALIHLRGRQQETLFVSLLLHGNEPTGWESVRSLLKKYDIGGGEQQLPRNLTLFVGNVEAARDGLRRLKGQPDFNRVWPGGENDSPESEMMQQVIDIMRQRNLFASIDIHNNTGLNPHYACINVINGAFLRLATLFSRLVIYFIRPTGVQSLAFSKLCPAVTIECGKVGDEAGIQHTIEFVDACLHLHELSDEPLHHEEVDLFHTVATVKIPNAIAFGFDDSNKQLSFHSELECFNFSELVQKTVWADVSGEHLPVSVTNENGDTVSERFFQIENGKLVNKVPVMPSMLTVDTRVIEQDCLCYLMERYALPKDVVCA